MDAIRLLETAAKSLRSVTRGVVGYLQDVRKAYDDTLDGVAEQARQHLLAREEAEEVLEPECACCACWVGHGACGGCSGYPGITHEPTCGWEWNPNCPVHPPTPYSPDDFGPCECVCRLCIQGAHCDTASCATLPDDEPTAECGTKHPVLAWCVCTKPGGHADEHGYAGIFWPIVAASPVGAPAPEPRCARCDTKLGEFAVVSDSVPGMFCSDRCRKSAEVLQVLRNSPRPGSTPEPPVAVDDPLSTATGAPDPSRTIVQSASQPSVRGEGSPADSDIPPSPAREHPTIEAICDVLAGHHGDWYCGGFKCDCTAVEDGMFVDRQEWREHVSALIASRLESLAVDKQIDAQLQADGFRRTVDIAADTYPQHRRRCRHGGDASKCTTP